MYTYKDRKLTKEQVDKLAAEKGVEVDVFLTNNPDIQIQEAVVETTEPEGKTPTTETDTTVDVTEVSDTESPSADGSLEPARTSVRKKTRKSDIEKNINKKLDESIEAFEENLIDLNPSNISEKNLISIQNTAVDYLVSTSEDPDNYSYTEEDVNAATKNILDKASGIRNRKLQLKEQVAGTYYPLPKA